MSQFVELMKRGGNQAIRINPPTGTDFHITNRGSDWLFSVFCVFMFFAIVYTLLMFRKPADERFVYYTGIAPTLFMSIAYFTMASNLGWSPVRAKYNHVRKGKPSDERGPGVRQIFYARFIGWFLALPWPVLQLSMLGSTPLWHIVFNIGMTCTFSVCFLIASQIHSTYKWGYWVFGTFAAIVVLSSLMTTTRKAILAREDKSKLYKLFTIFVWTLTPLWLVGYPVAFALSDGANVLQPDSGEIFYGIIDLLVLCFLPAIYGFFLLGVSVEKLGYNFTSAGVASEMPYSNTTNTLATEKTMSPSASSPTIKSKKAKKAKKASV